MAVPDFVMVPVAAGGPTKPTTSYQSMQSRPVSKPSTVSVPKSKTVPGTGISIVKGEKTAADEPLPVEILPANESNTNLSAKNTENVETKGSEHVTEYVATETDAVTSQVETAPHAQNTAHVETSPPEGISTHPPALLPKEASGSVTEHSTSETPVCTSSTGENGTIKEAADSSMEIEKDTSMLNLESPKTPVANLDDDDAKTDAYSDAETIPNTDNDTQIPDVNDKVIVTGNDTVEIPTDLVFSPNMTEKTVKLNDKSAVIKIQPLNDIEIDIWRNKVGSYYQFKADQTAPNEMNTPTLQTGQENDELPTSLRGRKGVDYTPMLTSDLDSEVETDRKKPKNYRPRASGPSTLRQQANKHSRLSKTDHTTTLIHSYPIRGYKQPVKAPTETPGSPLPVETDHSVDPESSQVETADSMEHVETEDSIPHGEPDSPVKGTLVTRSFELKKYKRPRRFKCKICGESATSVKDLNVHHRSTHDVQFCDDCGIGFFTKSALEKHIYIHKELQFVCDRCGMGFPFESRLSQHKITHHTYASLKCMKKNCDRCLKNVGDLN